MARLAPLPLVPLVRVLGLPLPPTVPLVVFMVLAKLFVQTWRLSRRTTPSLLKPRPTVPSLTLSRNIRDQNTVIKITRVRLCLWLCNEIEDRIKLLLIVPMRTLSRLPLLVSVGVVVLILVPSPFPRNPDLSQSATKPLSVRFPLVLLLFASMEPPGAFFLGYPMK